MMVCERNNCGAEAVTVNARKYLCAAHYGTTNAERAARATAALRAYQKVHGDTGGPNSDALHDLLTDLRHAARQNPKLGKFARALRLSRLDFAAETTPPDVPPDVPPEPPKRTRDEYHCAACGKAGVQVLEWVDPVSRTIEDGSDFEGSACYCPTCSDTDLGYEVVTVPDERPRCVKCAGLCVDNEGGTTCQREGCENAADYWEGRADTVAGDLAAESTIMRTNVVQNALRAAYDAGRLAGREAERATAKLDGGAL